jgi:hypothetical protein
VPDLRGVIADWCAHPDIEITRKSIQTEAQSWLRMVIIDSGEQPTGRLSSFEVERRWRCVSGKNVLRVRSSFAFIPDPR